MPDRYQTLFGASRPALDPALAGPEWVQEGIFLVNTRTGERRLKQVPGGQRATTAVPVPNTSLPAIAKDALGLAGATAADVNVGTARLPSLVLNATADTLKRGAGNLDPKGRQKKSERADAYMQLFGNPSMAEAIQDSHEARLLKLDPLAPVADTTRRWTEEARGRLAEATLDLPTPVAVGVHQAATMAGMLVDPTLAGGGKAPRALSEAAQEAAIAAGKRPGLGARAEAALQKGYGKLQDLDEADALLRDNLNRYPGYRKAYYEDRLDKVELGLQRLKETEDAAPTPPYLQQGDRASQAPPAVNPGLRLRNVGGLGPEEALRRLAREVPAGPISVEDLPFELRDLPLTRWQLGKPDQGAVKGIRFYAVGDQTAYARHLTGLGGNNLAAETFTPANPLVLNKSASKSAKAMGLVPPEAPFNKAEEALVKWANGKGYDSLVLVAEGDIQVAKLSRAKSGTPRSSPYLDLYARTFKDWRGLLSPEEIETAERVGRRHATRRQSAASITDDAGISMAQQKLLGKTLHRYGIGSVEGKPNQWIDDALAKIPDDGSPESIMARGYLKEHRRTGGFRGLEAAPSGPEALGAAASPPLSGQVAESLDGLRPSSAASPPLGLSRTSRDEALAGSPLLRAAELNGDDLILSFERNKGTVTASDIASMFPGHQVSATGANFTFRPELQRVRVTFHHPDGAIANAVVAEEALANMGGPFDTLKEGAPLPFLDSTKVIDGVSSGLGGPPLAEAPLALPPLGPRPGSNEAGFIKLRPDPLPPADAAAKEAAWHMRKEYAATERLGRYRAGARAEELQKLIPKETDEALTWMFHELGDPRSYANRPAKVAARIAKRPGAKRRVVEQIFADPNAESALQEVASWREQTKQMWDDLSDMWDLGFVKNYMHMTYVPPKGVKTVNPLSFGSVGATPGLTRSRTFLNPSEAMAAGWTPRTLRFSQLRAETEKVFAHAQAIRGLVDDLATMPLLQDSRPALTYATMGKQPKGYVRVSGVPVLEKAAQRSATSSRALPEAVRHAELLQAESRRAAETAGGFYRYTPEGGTAPSVIEQPSLPGTEGLGPKTFRPPRTPTTPGDLWIHPKIWEELKPVLDVAEPLKIDRLLGTVKRIKFLGSIFHPFELGLAAMQSMGPVKGAKAWASRGGGIPGLAQLAERRGWASPFTREVAEKWVRRGLGVEAPSADMMTDSFQRAMVDWEDMMTRAAGKAGAVARAAGAAGKGLRATAAYYDEAIWKILHSPIKIAAAEQWEAQLMAARNGDRGALGVANRFLTDRTRARLAAMTDEEIGEAVASGINNHFGGQVWELSRNRLFSDPRALKWMRRIFLSPDWNVSAISSGLSPLSSDPVHRVIGRTYWTNITALAAGFSVLNYSLTAGSEQGPHFPWENEEGHKMDLETPFRTDKGRKIFYRIGKHAQELPHFAWGTPGAQQMKFLAGKTSPWVGAAAGLMGKSVTEFPSPYEELVREREKTGEVPGPVEDIASRLEPTAEMALPFSLQDAEDPGDVLRKLLISIPESKGMSTYKAENLFAQALYENDSPRQTEIIQILRQNGYDDEAIGFMIQGAKRKAKRRLRAGR